MPRKVSLAEARDHLNGLVRAWRDPSPGRDVDFG
jgi:hypothetical protein